jgi:hypothetical protein
MDGIDGLIRAHPRFFAFYSFSISCRLVLNRQGRQERQGKAGRN